METSTTQQKDIRYYSLRLEGIIIFNREIGSKFSRQNLDKIRIAVDGYKKFEKHSNYDPHLVGLLKTLY